MEVINCEVVDAPVKMGDVLINNVCDTGADIVATNEV
jgi:CxxC motif-containing protein